MPVPDFAPGEILTAAAMDAVGLWRVTTCTVSSVGGTAATASNGVITVGTNNTSVTVSNAFSSDYDNYKIVYTGGVGSVNIDLTIQLGSANTNYSYALFYIVPPSATISQLSSSSAANWLYGGGMTTNGGGLDMDVYGPNLAKYTYMRNTYLRDDVIGANGTGAQKSTTQFTSFTLAPFSGNISGGKIRVYGYRN